MRGGKEGNLSGEEELDDVQHDDGLCVEKDFVAFALPEGEEFVQNEQFSRVSPVDGGQVEWRVFEIGREVVVWFGSGVGWFCIILGWFRIILGWFRRIIT